MKKYIAICFVFFIGSGYTFSEIPHTISYQGVLSDESGNVVPDDTYRLQFELHTTINNGTIAWQETHENVPVINGIFNVILGSINPLNISFDEPYYLAISVNDGDRLEPFTPFTSAPYSLGLADSIVTSGKLASKTAVRSINSLTDHVRLLAGDNVTITEDDTSLVISAQANGNGTGGDITAVNAGQGLSGGGISGEVELAIADSGVIESMLADSIITGDKIAEGQVLRGLRIGPINNFFPVLTDSATLKFGPGLILDAEGGPDGGLILSATANTNVDGHSLDAIDGDPVDAVFVDDKGRVGIGTKEPREQLDIRGNIELPSTTVGEGDSAGILLVNGKRFIHSAGSNNIFAGFEAGNLGVSPGPFDGGNNTAVGGRALKDITTGSTNTAIGVSALTKNTTGNDNVAIGLAMVSNTEGNGNVAIGNFAMQNNTNGNSNVAVGQGALTFNETGRRNTALGSNALSNNKVGEENVAIGAGVLANHNEGNRNTAVGNSAMVSNSTGANNVAVGLAALQNNETGKTNTAVGYFAMRFNEAGSDNTVIGSQAQVTLPDLTNATAIGANARVDASNKIRLGDDNVSVVETAGTISAAAFVGDGSGLTGLPTSQWDDVQDGIAFNKGEVGIGTEEPRTLLHIREDVNSIVALTIENPNTGDTSAERISFRDENGDVAAIQVRDDGFIGSNSAMQIFNNRPGGNIRFGTNGNLNRVILTNDGNLGIGQNNPALIDNILTIPKGSNTDPIADAWTTYSSRRWKTDIKTLEKPLDKINRLRGVSYKWKETGKKDIGLIAEEVGEVIPEVVTYEENGNDAKSVDYPRLVALLIEGMKTQQVQIEALQKELSAIRKETSLSKVQH